MTTPGHAPNNKKSSLGSRVVKAAPKKAIAPKKVSNPASTGGAGVTFENRVQAVKLLSLGLGIATTGVPSTDRIIALQFQAKRSKGPNTDDLVCTVERGDGQRYHVLMQMKRSLKAQPSDGAFAEAVGNAWLDFEDQAFKREADRIVIAYDSGCAHEMRGVSDVVKFAVMSLDAADWIEKLTAEGMGSPAKRKALAAIRSVVDDYRGSPVPDVELLHFTKHLSFAAHDLDTEDTAEYLSYITHIRHSASAVGVSTDARLVWAQLVTACMQLNGVSGAVDYSNLATVLGADLVVWFEIYRNLTGQRFVVPPALLPHARGNHGAHLGAPTWAGSVAQLSNPGLAANVTPAARGSGIGTIVSGALDLIHTQIKAGKYVDALAALKQLGTDQAGFDAHQKARRYHMRATCRWHQGDEVGASADFLRAAELCDDDDKLAAGRVRGLLLKGEVTEAVRVGHEALDRFPESLSVWLATSNAKLSNKEVLAVEDIPEEHRGEADALHMIAWGYYARGNSQEGRRLGLEALSLPTANFFTRDLALAFVLDDIAANPVSNAFRQLGERDKADLSKVLNSFEPRHEKLWFFEVPNVLADTAYRLAFGTLMLGAAERALQVVIEAKTRGIDNSNLLGIEMEALVEAGRPQDALRLGESRLDTLPVGGLVAFAQLARSTGDLAVLEKILDAMRHQYPAETVELAILDAMRWEVLAANGQAKLVLTQVETEDARVRASIPLLAAAARVLRTENEKSKAEEFVAKALELLPSDARPVIRYMVASLLMAFRRFADAASVYELILPDSTSGDIHRDLFYCYVRSDQRAKALALLNGFPPGWESDEETRRLAMELGQMAGDWALLKTLVAAQLKQHPTSARSWLFSLMVAVNTDEADAGPIVEQLPAQLDGSIHEQAQLASAEFEYGKASRGVRRLYSMVRRNLNSTEAASAMLAVHLWFGEKLIDGDAKPDSVQPGVTVTIEDDAGETRTATIDPLDCDELPHAEGFYEPASSEAARLQGLRVGESFTIKDGFSGERHYTVTSLAPAYRTIIEHAQRTLRASFTPSPAMTMLTLDTDEAGTLKLDKLTAQLEKSSSHANKVFAQYSSNHFTLGVIAKFLGRDVVSLVQHWPTGAHPLLVGGGTEPERAKATELLLTHPKAYVIDAATLTELAVNGCLAALRSLPKVIVSGKTQALLRHCLDLAKASRTVGVASAVDGQIVFQEVTAEQRAHEVGFIAEICEAVERDCVVVPSYGRADLPPQVAQVEPVISDEEYSAILLALEYDAVVISVDSRLRAMLEYCGATSVWPQTVLLHLATSGVLSTRDYSLAVLAMFLRNRSFIVLTAVDLLTLVYQGSATFDNGIRKFIKHIAEETTDFGAATKVTLTFLDLLGKVGVCQFGVVVELTRRMLDGLFRHKHCPDNFAERLVAFFTSSQKMAGWSPELKRYFPNAIRAAEHAARRKLIDTPLKAKVVFCGRPPHLLSGEAEFNDLVEIEAGPAVTEFEGNAADVGIGSKEDITYLAPENMMGK